MSRSSGHRESRKGLLRLTGTSHSLNAMGRFRRARWLRGLVSMQSGVAQARRNPPSRSLGINEGERWRWVGIAGHRGNRPTANAHFNAIETPSPPPPMDSGRTAHIRLGGP